jgi:hypothetical protein
MRNQPPGQPIAPPKLTYVDRPDVGETFADSVARVAFDGATLRLEFAVNRLDDARPPAQQTGRAVTACRLVLPANGMLDLYSRLSTLMNALQTQGVLKATPVGTTQPAS